MPVCTWVCTLSFGRCRMSKFWLLVYLDFFLKVYVPHCAAIERHLKRFSGFRGKNPAVLMARARFFFALSQGKTGISALQGGNPPFCSAPLIRKNLKEQQKNALRAK